MMCVCVVAHEPYLFAGREGLHCCGEVSVDVTYHCLTSGHTHTPTHLPHQPQFTAEDSNTHESTELYV